MSNIYYHPEAYDLEVVAEIDYSSGEYEFDTRVVWKNKDDNLFTARDSGCSCPTPFEDYNLSNIDPVDLGELEREVQKELAAGYGVYITAEEGQEFIAKVRWITGG